MSEEKKEIITFVLIDGDKEYSLDEIDKVIKDNTNKLSFLNFKNEIEEIICNKSIGNKVDKVLVYFKDGVPVNAEFFVKVPEK